MEIEYENVRIPQGSYEVAPTEDDSGCGDEIDDSTSSLASSIFDYEEYYGRFYHAFHRGKYILPNDEREQERMNAHHRSMHLVLGKRQWLAPIRPTRILDVGTGTGIWAMDVADEIPSAHVIGIDLSPIQPTLVPPNLEFQVMDADETWEGFEQRFDLVHTRFMNGLSVRSWSFFYEQAFAALAQEGWVENQELDMRFACDEKVLADDCAYVRWAELWNDGLKNLGMTGRCYPEQMKEQMENKGFINATIRSHRMPVGSWSTDRHQKEAGLLNLEGLLSGIHGLSQKVFLHGLCWSREDLELLLMEVRRELQSCCLHIYLPVVVLNGQKPPSDVA